jgi:hypothetical protein
MKEEGAYFLGDCHASWLATFESHPWPKVMHEAAALAHHRVMRQTPLPEVREGNFQSVHLGLQVFALAA